MLSSNVMAQRNGQEKKAFPIHRCNTCIRHRAPLPWVPNTSIFLYGKSYTYPVGAPVHRPAFLCGLKVLICYIKCEFNEDRDFGVSALCRIPHS